MTSKDAVIDMDGVLADFIGAFEEKFGGDHPDLVKLEERYPSRAMEIHDFVFNPETYRYLDDLPLGVQITKYLASKGFKIRIVSSRPPDAFEITRQWLEKLSIQYDSLWVDNTVDKVVEIKRIKPALAIDDIGAVAEKLAKLGIPALLISYPYNLTYKKKFARIRNFPGFLYQFKKILGNGVATNESTVHTKAVSHI